METIFIYGKHAVLEVLKQRRESVKEVYLKSESEPSQQETKLLKQLPRILELNPKKLPGGLDRKSVHQGWVAELDPAAIITPFKEFKKTLTVDESSCLVMLGEVQDPHNVGAVIRSAAAFGAAGVMIPKHRQASLSGTVIKVSAGTAFALPLVEVGNVNSALRDLKELGFWVYGLDMEGDTSLHQEDFSRPSVFVLGNEGKGVRQKTHELCDSILTIPMHPRAESLNVSASAAVALYAFSAKHPAVVTQSSPSH